jgi:hypothetical protein
LPSGLHKLVHRMRPIIFVELVFVGLFFVGLGVQIQ